MVLYPVVAIYVAEPQWQSVTYLIWLWTSLCAVEVQR